MTEQQSGQKYITLSLSVFSVTFFSRFREKCEQSLACVEDVFSPVAEKMLSKQDAYGLRVENNLAKLAIILDPGFGDDILIDSKLLCQDVILRTAHDDKQHKRDQPVQEFSMLEKIIEENNLHVPNDKEVISFLQRRVRGDSTMDL